MKRSNSVSQLAFNALLLGSTPLIASPSSAAAVPLAASRIVVQRDLKYFSNDYDTARAKFLLIARQALAADGRTGLESYPVPCSRTEGLFVDEFFSPPTEGRSSHTRRLLVLTAGVHGIEGYTGSAIEVMFLKEIYPILDRRHLGVLVTHALNPFGFKMHRRATEANINLNRNFLPQNRFKELLTEDIDHSYMRLQSLLEPAGPVSHPKKAFVFNALNLGSRLLTKQLGFQVLTQAIGQGQYRSPLGLEFGGTSSEPQAEAFTERLKLLSQDYDEILFLDLHTGLGDRYQLHLIPPDSAKSRDPKLMQEIFQAVQDKDIYKMTTGDTEGFYHTYGDITDILASFSRPGLSALSATVEFGTVGAGVLGKLKTLNRLILENQGYQFGYQSSTVRAEVMGKFDELFYPKENRSRSNVIVRSRLLLSRFLDRMSVIPNATANRRSKEL